MRKFFARSKSIPSSHRSAHRTDCDKHQQAMNRYLNREIFQCTFSHKYSRTSLIKMLTIRSKSNNTQIIRTCIRGLYKRHTPIKLDENKDYSVLSVFDRNVLLQSVNACNHLENKSNIRKALFFRQCFVNE